MEIEKLFKSIVGFYVILFVLSVFFLWDQSVEVFLYGEVFKENYTKIINSFPETETSSLIPDSLFALLTLVILIFLLVTAYRLFKFKSYARELFIIYLILIYFWSYVLTEDPLHIYLYSSPQSWSESLLTMIEGAIIVFIYFTPLKEKFIKN